MEKFSVIQPAHNIRRTEKGGKDAPGISGSLLLHSFCVRTRNGSRTAYMDQKHRADIIILHFTQASFDLQLQCFTVRKS